MPRHLFGFAVISQIEVKIVTETGDFPFSTWLSFFLVLRFGYHAGQGDVKDEFGLRRDV